MAHLLKANESRKTATKKTNGSTLESGPVCETPVHNDRHRLFLPSRSAPSWDLYKYVHGLMGSVRVPRLQVLVCTPKSGRCTQLLAFEIRRNYGRPRHGMPCGLVRTIAHHLHAGRLSDALCCPRCANNVYHGAEGATQGQCRLAVSALGPAESRSDSARIWLGFIKYPCYLRI